MKYSVIYINLINKAKNRILPKDAVYELHHITPKCLGGSNNRDNLVALLPREHFIAHKLLVKSFPDNEKLLFAYGMLSISSKNLGRTKFLSSKEYVDISIARSKSMQLLNPMKDRETVQKMQKTKSLNRSLGLHKQFYLSEEERTRRSNHMKLNNPMKNLESKEKMSNTISRLRKSGEIPWVMSEMGKQSISNNMKLNNPMKNPEIAIKSSTTFKQRKETGELILLNGKWRKNPSFTK